MHGPRLPLRDLFWLVALAALALGWYREHRSLRRELLEAKYDLLEARQSVFRTTFMNNYQRSGLMIPQQPRPKLSEAEIDAALQLLGGDWNCNTTPYLVIDP